MGTFFPVSSTDKAATAFVSGEGVILLAEKFDSIVMLDQPQAQWSHWKCFQATFKLMVKLETLGKRTVFRDNVNVKKILYWHDLVYNKNKSFFIRN